MQVSKILSLLGVVFMRTISLLLSLCVVAGCCDLSFGQLFQRRVYQSAPTVVSNAVATNSAQPVVSVSSATILANDRAVFRRAFLKSLRAAKQNGSISDLEHLRLVAMSLRPASLDKIRETIRETAIQEGLATVTAIDWDNLIEFMEKLIPLIIKLIDLFS